MQSDRWNRYKIKNMNDNAEVMEFKKDLHEQQ